MKISRIGIIREGKVPHDKRVPLTPEQILTVKASYPELEIVVQTSPIRCFDDNWYQRIGVEVVDSLEDCDLIMGVKEVNIQDLVPNKRFMFFSHTCKLQPYNQPLLKAILDKKIQLIDYEVLKDENRKRLIGFGRYAGIVGCYNAFLTYGLKTGVYDLTPAHVCEDRHLVEEELQKVVLPKNARIVLTGFGRVGNGAREIVTHLGVREVTPEAFLNSKFDEPVFTHLDTGDYFARKEDGGFDKTEFYNHPEKYTSILHKYMTETIMYIPCHYWSSKSPFVLDKNAILNHCPQLQVVADVSCDIDGPIGCTVRPSTIADPIYGYDPKTGKETDWKQEGTIAVMAVDNLPCELPRDASRDFGNEMIKNILPALLGEDPTDIIGRGSETDLNGKLTTHFDYLTDYVNGTDNEI